LQGGVGWLVAWLPTFREGVSVPSSSVKVTLDMLTLKDGTDTLSRNVGITNLRYVTTQKSQDPKLAEHTNIFCIHK